MTSAQMKTVLAQKFVDENCGFTTKDISIKKGGAGWNITVKDYEHIRFNLYTEDDDYFGKIVWVDAYYRDRDTGKYEKDCNVEFVDSKVDYRIEEALVRLGYYIASRF